MMTSSTIRALVMLIAAATLTASYGPTVDARRRPAPDSTVEAKRWYKMAVDAANAGNWGAAALAFDAAHRLDPAPELLYNAARAYEKHGKLQKALSRYKKFLVFKNAPTDLREKALERLIALKVITRGMSMYDLRISVSSG